MTDQGEQSGTADASGTRGGKDAGQRSPLGILSLDALLCGGLPEGNSVLLQGAPGTGKTVLGMQFLEAGITQFSEPGLMITFEEHPRRLYRDALALGWDFEGFEANRQLLVVFTSPQVFLKELETNHYAGLIRDYGLRRVVVDSLTQFEAEAQSTEAVRVRFTRIVNALRRCGLTTLMTSEAESREPTFRVTPEEYLADTIIQLSNSQSGGQRVRSLEILKNRGSAHSNTQHPFTIEFQGLHIQP